MGTEPSGKTRPVDNGMSGEERHLTERGRTDGLNHPLWADGSPILVGQAARWHVDNDEKWGPPKGVYSVVVHEVHCEEIRIGGMDADDQEWDEQVHPEELSQPTIEEPTYVEEGWWHPNVQGGQVHDHTPRQPATMHRLCEPVFTRRGATDG